MISDRLDRLVDEMVERGVQFDDAIHEFEKRFIARVLGCCDGLRAPSFWHSAIDTASG